MLLQPVDLERVEKVSAPRAGLRVGIISLTQFESSAYQDTLEREIVRALRESGLFETVIRDSFDPAATDLELHLGKADLSFRHHPNLAGLPLSVLTLGIYLFVGGPVWTHEQFFEIPVRVEAPGKDIAFEFVSRIEASHWMGLYSREVHTHNGRCPGPSAHLAMNDLVQKLADGLRGRALGRSRGERSNAVAFGTHESRSR